uniref:Mos1 transposase HTH domain-containing protein n=1 Tax=Acrobeloides nanus TaxID=290746 RepID=A0A914CKY9_9BILA
MKKNRGIIRELLKFEFELDHSAKEAMDNINRAKGNGTVSKVTAYLWYSKFRSNKMEIEDKKRSGRPREVDRVAVVNAVEAHPSMTTRILVKDFECSHTEIASIYCGQLGNTRRALRNRRIPVVFLDDNAKPHRSSQNLQKLEDMGWEYLEHPPYTPGLSPSDFYLFRSLEHWLRGKKFRTIEEMRESLTEFFDSKDREWYRRGIHKLEEQWQKVIESGGDYFDY